jgi:hypothetical protein
MLEGVSKGIGVRVDRILRMNKPYQAGGCNRLRKVELLHGELDHLIQLAIEKNRLPGNQKVRGPVELIAFPGSPCRL